MNDSEPRNPFTKKGFVVGAAIVGVLALSGIVLGVTSLDAGDDGNTAAVPGASTPTRSSTLSAEAESVCGLAGYEDSYELTAPPAVKWSITGTVAVPSSDTAGPGQVDEDGFRSCYAHTADGALLSAISFVALSSDTQTAARVTELVAPGPGKDIALSANTPGSNPSSGRLQLAGYKITSYSATESVVDLAWEVTSAGGQLVSLPVALKWAEGDWKVELADNGQPRFTASPLESLGGYTSWNGV
jgi:hypothetical protein